MHHHVMSFNALGVVFREHSFDDPIESIEKFLALTREFFQDKIVGDHAQIEQQMYASLSADTPEAVTIGNPAFCMAWIPCEDCTNMKIYN